MLIDQEVEVLHDEFRTSLARQGITEEAYLKVVEKTDADLHADFRPNAEKRVKTLLVLSKIADERASTFPTRPSRPRSPRAASATRTTGVSGVLRVRPRRSFIRSTLRRSRLVEQLVDEWLTSHPDHPALPHVEEPSRPPPRSRQDRKPHLPSEPAAAG